MTVQALRTKAGIATHSISLTSWLVALVVLLYLGLRIPLLVSDIPNWYHPFVESNSVEVAESMAEQGNQDAVVHISVAGYNLHGILATPVFLLNLDARLVRLVTLAAGAIAILYIWKIQKLLGASRRSRLATAALLAAMPHFTLLTGFAMPQSVTATFGAIAIYYYLRWRLEGRAIFHVALSALFSGLGAFNHFSGLVIAATIAALIVAEFLATRKWLPTRPQTVTLASVFILANLPALILWYSRKSDGQLDFYEKYQINNSSDLLFTASWWRAQLHYTSEYQPIFLLIGLAALVIVGVRLTRGTWLVPAPLWARQTLNPLYFWSTWFVIGILQIPLFPQGSFIHEYYVWWALLPSVPLFVSLVQHILKGRRTLQTATIVLVLVLSTTIAAAQVSRAHGATDIPLLCRYQDC